MRVSGKDEGRATMDEGVQILKITEAEYDEDFGSVNLKLTNKAGAILFKNFALRNAEDEVNEGMQRAYIHFGAVALDKSGKDVDFEETDLIGKYVEVNVEVDAWKLENKGKRVMTFNPWQINPASGFSSKKASSAKKSDDIDLDAELD